MCDGVYSGSDLDEMFGPLTSLDHVDGLAVPPYLGMDSREEALDAFDNLADLLGASDDQQLSAEFTSGHADAESGAGASEGGMAALENISNGTASKAATEGLNNIVRDSDAKGGETKGGAKLDPSPSQPGKNRDSRGISKKYTNGRGKERDSTKYHYAALKEEEELLDAENEYLAEAIAKIEKAFPHFRFD